MIQLSLLRSLSIIIPKVSTIRLRNSPGTIGCHGRTASYPTAPAQIPACGTTALGSSEILASVKDTLVLPSLLFPAGRFAFVIQSYFARQMFPLQATYSVSPCAKTPTDPLQNLTFSDSFVQASVTENDVAICINLYLRGCIIHFRKYGLPYGLSVSRCTLHLMVTHFNATLRYGWLARPYPTRTFTLQEI